MRVFLLFITISVSSTSVVEWTPNTSFNLPMNFRDHKLPCSRQAVVFPESVQEAIKFESDIAVRELVLPKNGEMLFEDAVMVFGADDHDNCTESGTAYYVPKMESSWADPDVWSSPKFNEATPDAERVPCYDDEVFFPAASQFTVTLPQDTQYVRKLTIRGMAFDTLTFHLFVTRSSDVSQMFVLNDHDSTGVFIGETECTNPIGCPCQKYVLQINCEQKFCPKPKCFDPIQPIGHCCKICGGYLVIDIGPGFDIFDFEENVAQIINSYGKDTLVSHIGILPEDKVQLVVVSRGEYDGTSTEAVNEIASQIDSKGLKSLAYFSGIPTSQAGMGAKIAFSMFFVVVLVMGAIYVYYYRTPRLPQFSYPAISRNTRGIFARFATRSQSVVSLTSRRGSTDTVRSSFGTAFRNPMYDSKRGRVQVTETVAEE